MIRFGIVADSVFVLLIPESTEGTYVFPVFGVNVIFFTFAFGRRLEFKIVKDFGKHLFWSLLT